MRPSSAIDSTVFEPDSGVGEYLFCWQTSSQSVASLFVRSFQTTKQIFRTHFSDLTVIYSFQNLEETLAEQIRRLEERILYLESLSPEYFSRSVSFQFQLKLEIKIEVSSLVADPRFPIKGRQPLSRGAFWRYSFESTQNST